MRSIFYTACVLVFASLMIISCGRRNSNSDIPGSVVTNPNSADGKASTGGLPVISFEKDFHDFGKLISGEQVTYAFKFKNTGNSLLLISSVSTSCGCTVSSFPKQPIKPGEGATVDVSFDSQGRHGIQTKTVTVFANTQPPTTTLRIQSLVYEADEINK